MVAVEIGLAFGAVDYQLVYLADTAPDLHGGGEHGTAHTHYACLTDTLQDSLRILQLLLGEGRHELRCVLKVVLYNNGHYHVSQRMGPGLDSHDLSGDGGVDRCGDGNRVFADLLIHLHIVPHLDQRLTGGTYVLYHRYHDLGRRRNDGHWNFRSLHIVRVYAAFKSMGH